MVVGLSLFNSSISLSDNGTEAITNNNPISGDNKNDTQNEVEYPIFLSLPTFPTMWAITALMINPKIIPNNNIIFNFVIFLCSYKYN